MSTVTVRLATESDQSAVLNLLDELACFLDVSVGAEPHVGQVAQLKDSLYPEVINNPQARIFVAEDQGQIVGVVTFFILPHLRTNTYRGQIGHFVVAGSQRGKGVGKLLFAAVKDFCRSQHIKVFKLSTGLQLTDAQQFYEKMGGQTTERIFRFEVE